MITTGYAPAPMRKVDVWAVAFPGSLTGGMVCRTSLQTQGGFTWGGSITHGWPRHLWPIKNPLIFDVESAGNPTLLDVCSNL